GAKILRQRRDDFDAPAVTMFKSQLLRMQRQPVDKGALRRIAFTTIVALEITEQQPRTRRARAYSRRPGSLPRRITATAATAVVKRIDHQRHPDICEVHADLMCLSGSGEAAEKRVAAEELLDLPNRSR